MGRFAVGVLVGIAVADYLHRKGVEEDRNRPPQFEPVLTVEGRDYTLAELRALTAAIDARASAAATSNTADFGPFETQTSVEFLWGDGTVEEIVGVLVE